MQVAAAGLCRRDRPSPSRGKPPTFACRRGQTRGAETAVLSAAWAAPAPVLNSRTVWVREPAASPVRPAGGRRGVGAVTAPGRRPAKGTVPFNPHSKSRPWCRYSAHCTGGCFGAEGLKNPPEAHTSPLSASFPTCWKPPAAASDICLNQRKGLGPRTFRGLSPAQTLPRAAGVRRKKCPRCVADSRRDTRESCLAGKQDDSPLRHRRLQTPACRTRCSTPTGRGARPAVDPALLLERGKGTRVVLCAESSGT